MAKFEFQTFPNLSLCCISYILWEAMFRPFVALYFRPQNILCRNCYSSTCILRLFHNFKCAFKTHVFTYDICPNVTKKAT